MSIHSHGSNVSQAALRKEPDEQSSERRTQILDAAERRFSRSGFHRTTMQDVAAEAGMSPGNLYRYFSSKDALVAGMCERDRASLAQEFSGLHSKGSGFLAAFRELGARHFRETETDKAKLCLEIWAEATRNPAVAALQADFHQALKEELVQAFEAAKLNGSVAPTVDSNAVASILVKLGDGLFVRRATADDFDVDREVGEVLSLIGSLLQGKATLACPALQAGAQP
jgi:TetR/AcrR family transcriptional repressor of uid operon